MRQPGFREEHRGHGSRDSGPRRNVERAIKTRLAVNGKKHRGWQIARRCQHSDSRQEQSMTPSPSLSSDATLWHDSRALFSPPAYRGRTHRPQRRVYYLSHKGALSEPSRSPSKRLFDVLASGGALMVLSPLLLAIAAAIKLTSPGPVFFTQLRYGHRNRPFRIFKFRTMHVQLSDKSGITQTVGNDPRVTLLGRVLRQTSLDELPQLINVLIGDMSLVGPRPHVPGMKAASVKYEDLVPYYFQ